MGDEISKIVIQFNISRHFESSCDVKWSIIFQVLPIIGNFTFNLIADHTYIISLRYLDTYLTPLNRMLLTIHDHCHIIDPS